MQDREDMDGQELSAMSSAKYLVEEMFLLLLEEGENYSWSSVNSLSHTRKNKNIN